MYRKTVNYLRGSVRLRVESSYPERVINLCAAHGVPFWGLQWESETVFHVRTTRHSLPLLRQITQEVECTVTTQEERGAPVLLCRGKRRYALMAGALLLVLLSLCGNIFIWGFRVSGNETVPEEAILRALENCGITVGSVGLELDQRTIRNQVLLELPDLSWLVVNVKGCTAHVQVLERQRPPRAVQEDEITNVVVW